MLQVLNKQTSFYPKPQPLLLRFPHCVDRLNSALPKGQPAAASGRMLAGPAAAWSRTVSLPAGAVLQPSFGGGGDVFLPRTIFVLIPATPAVN
jgi:hypothetical protein